MIDASTADQALAAIALVAMAVDSTLPRSWAPKDEGDLGKALVGAGCCKALAMNCIPIVARSESGELWEGDQEWWAILRRLALAVGCSEHALEGLGPEPSPAEEEEGGSVASEEQEALRQRGRDTFVQMKDHGRANDREAFDAALGTFFYCAMQLDPDAVQEAKEKPLEQWVRELSNLPAFDGLWDAAKSGHFGMIKREFEGMLDPKN